MKHSWLRWSPCWLLLAACSTQSEGSKTPTEPAPIRPDEGPTSDSPSRPAAEKPLFEEELAEIRALRGIVAKDPVIGKRVSREALRAHLEQTFETNVPIAEQSGTEEMLVGLADLPREFRFKETWLSLMQSELAGLYDPKEDTLFVVEGLDTTLDRATLLHELVHAVEDQTFDLDRLTEPGEDRGDQRSAISALAEGDATSVMFDAMLRPEGKNALDIPPGIIETQLALGAGTAAKDVPPLIIRSMIAPYIDGIAFVHSLRTRGGFTEVDRVWGALPDSTEQVLHLDKYDADEAPVSVALPAPPEPGFEVLFHDVWGEQSLRLLLEEWVEHRVAAAAAAGWGGDRLAAFSRGEERAVAGVWVMDTPKDADELLAAFGARRTEKKREDSFCVLGKNGLPFAVARAGKTIAAASGPYIRAQAASNSACTASLAWARRLVRSQH